MKKILFITHNSSRTGAPLVLLYFLQWLRRNHPEVDSSLLTIEGGVLDTDFKKVVNNYYQFPDQEQNKLTSLQVLKRRILKKMRLYKRKSHSKNLLLQVLGQNDYDLIYANTAVSIPVANEIKEIYPKAKLMAHIHEMKTIISLMVPDFSSYTSKIEMIIAVSNAVKKDLENKYFIAPEKIRVVRSFALLKPGFKASVTTKFIIGGGGTVHWRKGSDLFIQVAQQVKKMLPEADIEFRWVGKISGEEEIIKKADIEKAGLIDVVSFQGEKKDPMKYFSEFNVFLMPSREDPFPLVAIEVGMLGKPIICFEKATGTAEELKDGGGFAVPYLDMQAMAEKVIYYYTNREALKKDGMISQKIFSKYTSGKICPQIFSLIKMQINE